MPKDLRQIAPPVGLPVVRDMYEVTVHADDRYEVPSGFIAMAGTAGNMVVRSLWGSADQTISGLTTGAVVGMGDIPLVLSAVGSTADGTTVSSFTVGIL